MDCLEIQPFLRNRLFLLVFLPLPLLLLFITYGAVQQLVFGRGFGAQPAPDGLLGLLWLTLAIFTLCMASLKLVVRVNNSGVRVYLTPFGYPRQTIPFADIVEVVPKKYDPWPEHGGWGWRSGKTQVYTAYGSAALRLKLRDERSVLLGTQQQEKLAAAIREGIKTMAG